MNQKLKTGMTIAVIVVVSVLSFTILQKRGRAKAVEIEAERNQLKTASLVLEKRLDDLAKRHHAIPFRPPSIPDGMAFTIDYQRALIDKENRPVLITVELADVLENNGLVKARFRFDRIAYGDVFFELECSQEQSEFLLRQRRPWNAGRFAIIARVTSVRRPGFNTTAEVEEGFATVEIEPSDVVIASGRCLELLKI